MKITTEITERDKKLLLFLAVFLVVVGYYWFIIKPMTEEISALDTQIINAEALEKQNRHSISKIDEYKELLTEAKSELGKKSERFFPIMRSKDVDAFLTTRALDAGFEKSELRELNIRMSEGFIGIPEYQAEERNKVEELKGLYCATVSFTLHGEREELNAFVDELMELDGLRVTGIAWARERGSESGWQMTVQLKIYMSDAGEVIPAAPASE